MFTFVYLSCDCTFMVASFAGLLVIFWFVLVLLVWCLWLMIVWVFVYWLVVLLVIFGLL